MAQAPEYTPYYRQLLSHDDHLVQELERAIWERLHPAERSLDPDTLASLTEALAAMPGPRQLIMSQGDFDEIVRWSESMTPNEGRG